MYPVGTKCLVINDEPGCTAKVNDEVVVTKLSFVWRVGLEDPRTGGWIGRMSSGTNGPVQGIGVPCRNDPSAEAVHLVAWLLPLQDPDEHSDETVEDLVEDLVELTKV